MTFEDLKALKIPIGGGIAIVIAACSMAWGVFSWADGLKDDQQVTQAQLDQLVVIVSQKVVIDDETHEVQEEDIERVEQAFELLKQELELRRELGNIGATDEPE